MSRLTAVPDNDPKAADVFKEIKATRGFVSNALRSLAHSPDALRHFARLGAYIKYDSVLSEYLRELVIISAAKQYPYEWEHHAPLALQAGVTQEQLESIKAGQVPTTLPTNEQALVRLVLEMNTPDGASEETFSTLRKYWNPHEITDLIISATYYRALGAMATTLGVQLETPDVLDVERAWQKDKVESEKQVQNR